MRTNATALLAGAAMLLLAGPVEAQETTAAEDLRAVIEDIRDGQLDDFKAADRLEKAIRKQKARTRRFYRRAGATQEITLLGTDRGISTYLVRFESALAIIRFARKEEGDPIRRLGWHIVEWTGDQPQAHPQPNRDQEHGR